MINLSYKGKKDFASIEALAKKQIEAQDALPECQLGMLIFGDNFAAMARMLELYQNKIDLIYIDPPFNTQTNFYSSPGRTAHVSHSLSSQLAYSDKMEFDEYIEYMRERLFLISQLLSPVGTLYVHIDIKVGHYLKIVLDEIFGHGAFLNEISRVKSNPKNFQRRAFGNQKDSIYVYAKEPGNNIFNNIKEKPNPNDLLRLYPKMESTGRRYATVPCHAPGETRNGLTGGKWRGISPPPGRHWRCSPDELENMDKEGMIEWSKNNVPRIKKYADQCDGLKIQDIWLEYKDPPYPLYPTEKNMAMLEMIIRQASNPDSLVMDSFCGSGAFLAAAMRNGRRPIGIDCSETAIKTALKRPELARIRFIELDA